jgi:hypothetical protein
MLKEEPCNTFPAHEGVVLHLINNEHNQHPLIYKRNMIRAVEPPKLLTCYREGRTNLTNVLIVSILISHYVQKHMKTTTITTKIRT